MTPDPVPASSATSVNCLDSTAAGVRRRARHRAFLLGAVLLIGLGLRLPTFARPLLSDDEAIYATTADAVRRGAVLYRDVVDHKPPAIYDVYLAGFAALGPYNTQGAHALVVLAVLVCALALWRSADRVYQDDGAAIAAALLWVVFSTTMLAYDSLAANCELFLVCAQAVAFVSLVSGAEGRPRGPLAWAGVGVLAGASAMFKYQGATFGLVIVTAAAIEWLHGRKSAAGAVGAVTLAGAGCLIVPAFYGWRLWHDGGLDAARYWFTFNFSYVGAGPSGWEALRRGAGRTLLVGGVGAGLLYVLGLRAAWQTVTAWRQQPAAAPPVARVHPGAERQALAVAWLVSGALSVGAGGRYFGHYFHHLTPALSLLAALPLARAWRERRTWRPVLTALILVPAAAGLACATVLRPAVIARTDPEPEYARVAAVLDRVAKPDDAIFVWGNSPQLYVLARRAMGARFSFCNYLTGISPGTRTETGEADAQVNELPDAWRMLFDDLERRQPAWFVDAAAAGWDGYAVFPVSRYRRLEAYVQAHYGLRARVDGVGIYQRGTR